MEMPENLKRVETMSWASLKALAIKELATIPAKERIVFEARFNMKWPQFEQFILSLASAKSTFKEISLVHERVSTLGDFSGKDIIDLTMMSTSNIAEYQSPKIEYYLICRALHTRN